MCAKITCARCGGTGKYRDRAKCDRCDGTGKVRTFKAELAYHLKRVHKK